jgi:hypothetical protein
VFSTGTRPLRVSCFRITKQRSFSTELKSAADHLAARLHDVAGKPSERGALQERSCLTGEILSSALLAAVLNDEASQPGRSTRAVASLPTRKYTCAVPLMSETFAHSQNELRRS